MNLMKHFKIFATFIIVKVKMEVIIIGTYN